MNTNLPYDVASPKSIESYASKLINKTFRDVLPNEYKEYRGKGGLGQLLEKYYFLYEPNSDSGPDFCEAGVELKTHPFKENKRGNQYSAKERLVLNMINYMEVHLEDFESSTFLKKNRLILVIEYLFKEEIPTLDYVIKYAQLFEIPEEDLKIIKDDWNKIVNKIRIGKAHELSEGDTNYLGAVTKGQNKNSVRPQPFSNLKAKQRAFSFKQSYMTYVLNEYIIKGKTTYVEPIIKDINVLSNKTFEEYIIDTINKYVGKTIEEIADLNNVKINSASKNYPSAVALAMLGVKDKKAKEFEKANIVIKTIRVNNDGNINESMSFPTFKFTEIINEVWEDSTLRNIFLNTRFLFVIYKFDSNGSLRLYKSMFWNIPYTDLEVEIRSVWENTIETIKNGVKIVRKAGNREFNNLPSSSDNKVAHVRPHAQNKNDTYPLPTGGEFTKQSFWLNREYIIEQINSR